MCLRHLGIRGEGAVSFEGAARREGRRSYGGDAFDRCGCVRRMLRVAVCTPGNRSRRYRKPVGVARQRASVDDPACHRLGRRRMGLDRLAIASDGAEASHVNARHDVGIDRAADDGRAVAVDREASHTRVAGLTTQPLIRCLERQRML